MDRPDTQHLVSWDGETILDRLLYRDGLILVINKPAGIPVHMGPGGGDHLEAHFDALRFGLPKPPALAHRLDADTSGCLALGRHAKALRKLGRLFSDGRVEKTYWAVVEGAPEKPSGTVDLSLKKISSRQKGWRMILAKDGQTAVTLYRVLGQAAGKSWVEFRPKTGRTHQIRVHAAALGCPIVGDPLYGRAQPGERLQLHARRLRLALSANKPAIDITAPAPAHMRANLRACGWSGEDAAPQNAVEAG